MDSPSKTLPEVPAASRALPGGVIAADKTGSGSVGSVSGAQRTWRRLRRTLSAFLVVLLCLYAFRVPILRSVAGYLVVEERGTAAYVLILASADRRDDHTASLYHSGSVSGVLLVESRPKRLERMGFKSSFVTLTQNELAARGVPRDAITVLPGQARTDWDRARILRDWLQQKPAVAVVVLCDRFGGRRLRYLFDQILGADDARRVRVSALPERRFDETDWWQHRLAIVNVFDSYLRLAYDRLSGEDSEEWREWDPEDYNKKLR